MRKLIFILLSSIWRVPLSLLPIQSAHSPPICLLTFTPLPLMAIAGVRALKNSQQLRLFLHWTCLPLPTPLWRSPAPRRRSRKRRRSKVNQCVTARNRTIVSSHCSIPLSSTIITAAFCVLACCYACARFMHAYTHTHTCACEVFTHCGSLACFSQMPLYGILPLHSRIYFAFYIYCSCLKSTLF